MNAGVVITNKVAMLVHHATYLTMHLSSYEIIFLFTMCSNGIQLNVLMEQCAWLVVYQKRMAV